MTELLFGGGIILASILISLWLAKRLGRAEVERDLAEKDRKDDRKAAEVLVQHRSTDDTVGRLSDGKF